MFQYTPYALLSLAAMLVSLWLAFAIWSRRPGTGIVPFVVLALALTVWTFGNFARLSAIPLSGKVIFTHLTYIGITIVPAGWLLFILEYTGKSRWITRQNIFLLCIEPVLVQFAILTNPIHYEFWQEFYLEDMNGIVVLHSTPGSLFWIHAIYSYVLLLASCVVLLRTLYRSPYLYRGQVIYLLIAVFAPWVANVVYLTGLSPLPDFVDLTPLAFMITVLAVGWSMYRFRLLDLVPIARDNIVENMEDAILVLDLHKRIVDINSAGLKLLRKSSTDVIGQSIMDVLAHRLELIQEYENVDHIETELQIDIEEKAYFFKLRISGIYNRQGEISGHIVVLHDITSLKETNIALKEANRKAEETTRLKSQFLATMSHELRTPLNAIIGYTELQLEGMVGELTPVQHQYQERVLSNAEHLLGLINDILDLSKIEAGRMDLIRQPFVLREWVGEIVQQNIVLSEEKGIQFECDVDERLPEVLIGDSSRLRQILVNLLSNAIKFTHVGSVKLSVRQYSKNTWQISVEDTGIGIAPHKQETIFDEFHQVDNSSSRGYGGTGLGLAIVRKLVLSMGGNIRVSSKLGEGSQFTVILPLESQPADSEAQANQVLQKI